MIKTPFIAVLLIIAAQSQDPQCCHNVNSHPECQEVCDQMALETSHTGRQRHVTNLRTHCPLTLGIFWHCINSTASDIWSDDSTWYGQRCCSEARNQDCGHACQRALSTADIMDSCSVGIEGAIFDCLARYESQQSCCSQAPAGSYCRSKCLMIYELDNPSSEDELTINRYCGGGEGYVQVQQCVHNYTTSLPVRDPTESLHCCEYASDVACKDTCRNVLQTMSRDSDIMDGLTQTCGLPLPQNPLWKCFLWNSGNNDQEEDNGLLTNSALDGAHLECCFKAFSHTCRDLCVKLYTQNGANSNEFDEHCQYQPAETNLLQCLADVQEPCQLGCSGLNYCSNFNGRPTDFFRSCTARSDRGAEDDINLWQNGKIEMPFLDIPVLDINSCEPAMWKAIACTLQIKPCHSKSHVNMICKSDCIAILGKCLDVSRLKRDETAESLCTMLSPNDETTPCISLSQYLEPSSHGARMHEVSIPCHNNPCKNESLSLHELCSINRGSCSYNDVCLDYMCHEGCKLGDGSDFLVPQGSFVNIADAPSMDQACYKVCKCGHSNILEDCQAMKCISTQPCKEGGQIKDHHTHFHVDCNTCSCYAGELICSLRQCLSDESTAEERRRFTGLPCDSADDFLPVCAVNGRTYPNAQIAKCIGFDDNYFEIGTCISKDSCHPNPCLSDEQCISHKQVCLQSTECKQYVCVNAESSCAGEVHEPVCDTEGREHPNLCTLHRRRKMLAYRGRCQDSCVEELAVTVCGQNGETYSSKCAAWSNRVLIDYPGTCQSVGIISSEEETYADSRCATVKCAKPDISTCIGITPPGACCPVCAGQLRILYSTVLADEIVAVTNEPVTLYDVLASLRRHVSVSECDLFGYLSIDGSIIVLVAPIIQSPTDLQVDACNKEALKLEALINSRSPLVSAFIHLSVLTSAFAEICQVQIVSSARCLLSPYFSLSINFIVYAIVNLRR